MRFTVKGELRLAEARGEKEKKEKAGYGLTLRREAAVWGAPVVGLS